eukprot:Skav220856  [mRNA]  locus=scaffold1888:598387:599342:- [translate_table: standard]
MLQTTWSCFASFQAWMTPQFWEKIQYVSSIDKICEEGRGPGGSHWGSGIRALPGLQVIQRQDAQQSGNDLPVNFGAPVRRRFDSRRWRKGKKNKETCNNKDNKANNR